MKYPLGSFPLWCRDYSLTNCDLGTIARCLSHEMWRSDNPWQANPIRVSPTKCDSGTFCDVFESSNMTRLLYSISKSQLPWLVGELCLGYGEAWHSSLLHHLSWLKNLAKVPKSGLVGEAGLGYGEPQCLLVKRTLPTNGIQGPLWYDEPWKLMQWRTMENLSISKMRLPWSRGIMENGGKAARCVRTRSFGDKKNSTVVCDTRSQGGTRTRPMYITYANTGA